MNHSKRPGTAISTIPISLLYAFNNSYAQHAAASLASLIRHSVSPLDVLVVSTDEPSLFQERFERSFASEARVSLRFKQFTVPSEFPIPAVLSADAYLRLWADELFKGRSRTIYIDPDTVAVGSIEPLWKVDLQGRTIGAVAIPNSSRPHEHGMPAGSLFFNSGMLVMDLDAWKAKDYRRRCIKYLREHPERALDADQDILNLVLIGDWMPLDYKWNVINPFFRPFHDLGLSDAQRRRVCDEAVIIHFNGGAKPWKYLDNHPLQQAYFDNLARTEWRDFRPPDRTLLNIFRKKLQPYVPQQLKSAVKTILRKRHHTKFLGG